MALLKETGQIKALQDDGRCLLLTIPVARKQELHLHLRHGEVTRNYGTCLNIAG
ncbi:hypothetical protein HGH93_30965 [Chitinophaga polysaccharea]|uniref:hypothetical protein n=1 Tax=Chitinophaga TaxID=79328 RepID=UPI001455570A|nr:MULTISPECIES: hypothetical protein [Chitinophaga]NLR62554.1 hypothetical protein [Chitinophaga polysaccharea]NLU91512.1 hypothetical protein [Chitinophaga sp. Ak27]